MSSCGESNWSGVFMISDADPSAIGICGDHSSSVSAWPSSSLSMWVVNPETFAMLIIQAPPDQSMQVFSLVISLITIGTVIVTVNSKLLGGKV